MSSTAGIARSFTTRINNRKKSVTDGSSSIGRAFSMRKLADKPQHAPRPEISMPIELISATNPLALTAPDIYPRANPGSATLSNSGSSPILEQKLSSVASMSSLRSESSVPTLTSSSSTFTSPSPISTPITETSHEQDVKMLEHRLTALPESEDGVAATKPDADAVDDKLASEAPIVPKRAPSHTKKTHQAVHRQRSLSRTRSPNSSATNLATSSQNGDTSSGRRSATSSLHGSKEPQVLRNSVDMFSARTHLSGSSTIAADHPFGAELAQLTEVAEEFSPTRARHADVVVEPLVPRHSAEKSKREAPREPSPTPPKFALGPRPSVKKIHTFEPTIWDDEQEYLNKHGLSAFSAEEYMAEIGNPFAESTGKLGRTQWA